MELSKSNLAFIIFLMIFLAFHFQFLIISTPLRFFALNYVIVYTVYTICWFDYCLLWLACFDFRIIYYIVIQH